MKTMIRKTTTNGALTALATAGLLAFAGTAQASFIVNIASQDRPFDASLQDGPTNAQLTGAAFDAETAFLSLLDSSVTETFEGFSHDTRSPSTSVGTFQRGPAAGDGTGTNCTPTCDQPSVFDQAEEVSNSGRYNVTQDGSMYLDSNDVSQVEWDLSTAMLDPFTNALGFYLMDPADQGATFRISTDNSTELFNIAPGQKDGALFYVSALSTTGPITSAAVLFENTDENTADGFGVDDVTVGVPAPGMLAMLGSGLLALGLFGRGRKTRVTA